MTITAPRTADLADGSGPPVPDDDVPPPDPEDRWVRDEDGTVWVREVACPSMAAADRFHEARQHLLACHDQIVAAEREVERRQAHLVRLRAELAGFGDECARARCGPDEQNTDEERRLLTSALAVELAQSTRTLANQVKDATDLVTRLPRVVQAWADGLLHAGQVRVIDRHAEALTPDQCADYEKRVLAIAQGLTPAQLGQRAGRIARALNPRHAAARAARAFEKRGVFLEPEADGSSTLTIRGPSTLVEAAFDRLMRGARARDKQDDRTILQWMADAALVQLVCGTNSLGLMEGIRAHVSVTLPAPVLTGAGLDGTGYRPGNPAASPNSRPVSSSTTPPPACSPVPRAPGPACSPTR